MPITVHLKSATQHKPSLTVPNAEEMYDTEVVVGHYYLVLTDSELGFNIVECQGIVEAGFAGISLEDKSLENSEKYMYKKTEKVKVFDCDDVQSMLSSVVPEVVNGDLYISVNKSEIDEVLLAIIN